MTRRQVLQAMVAACLLVLAAFVGSALRNDYVTPDPLPAGGSSTDIMVVIGTGGVGPGDLDATATPNLWQLLRDGSSAALNITAVHANTCPIDGWLTLSAGDRAGQPDGEGQTPPCQPLPDVVSGFVSGWSTLTKAAADRPYDSKPGTMAQVLADKGLCVAAIGPGAAVAAALPASGAVQHYLDFRTATLTTGLASCRTSLVDVGAVRDPGDPDLDAGQAASPLPTHAQQVAAIDARVGQVIAAAPAGADVVLVSLADDGRTPGLRLVLAAGPRFGPGSLYSPSTRQTGLVQLDDVTATIISRAGVAVPQAVSGAALRRSPAPNNSELLAEKRLADLVDYDQSSLSVRPIVYPFFLIWGLVIVAALGVLALMWWRDLGTAHQRESVRAWVRKGLVVAAGVPVATFLANIVPWWRFTWPAVTLVLTVAVWTAVIGAIALRGAWRLSPMGPVAAVAATTLLVLGADVINGSRLQLASLLGLNPIVGGRFFGMGNVTFALFAAATFLVAIAVSSRLVRARHPRIAALAVGLIGLVAVIVDATPIWGSDAGGPPALVPGLAVLLLAILRIRVTWRRVLVIGGATVGLVVVVAMADWLRGEGSRSHLGRFVQSVFDGDAGGIISRKLAQNVDTLLHTTPLAFLVPVALVLLVYVVVRPHSRVAAPLQPLLTRVETMGAGLTGLVVTLVIGFFINDTGVAIPPVAFALVVPLLLSAAIRLWELRSREGRALTRAERLHS